MHDIHLSRLSRPGHHNSHLQDLTRSRICSYRCLVTPFTDDLADVDDIEIPDALAKPFLKRFGGKP